MAMTLPTALRSNARRVTTCDDDRFMRTSFDNRGRGRADERQPSITERAVESFRACPAIIRPIGERAPRRVAPLLKTQHAVPILRHANNNMIDDDNGRP